MGGRKEGGRRKVDKAERGSKNYYGLSKLSTHRLHTFLQTLDVPASESYPDLVDGGLFLKTFLLAVGLKITAIN